MGSMLQAIIACCRDELWRFIALPDAPAVQITVETSSAFLTCFCEAREDEGQVICYARYPIKVPPERRAAVMEFLARATWNVPIGGFEFSLDSGEVRYKTALEIAQETLTPGLVRPLIRHALLTADHYLDGFLQVALGRADPAGAIEALDLFSLDDVMSEASRSL